MTRAVMTLFVDGMQPIWTFSKAQKLNEHSMYNSGNMKAMNMATPNLISFTYVNIIKALTTKTLGNLAGM